MGISIVSFKQESAEKQEWGVLRDDNIFPIQAEISSHQQLMQLFLVFDDWNKALNLK